MRSRAGRHRCWPSFGFEIENSWVESDEASFCITSCNLVTRNRWKGHCFPDCSIDEYYYKMEYIKISQLPRIQITQYFKAKDPELFRIFIHRSISYETKYSVTLKYLPRRLCPLATFSPRDINTFKAVQCLPRVFTRELESHVNNKNSLVPLSIIERCVLGWLNLPRTRSYTNHGSYANNGRAARKEIITRERGFSIELYSPAEKQMGHGRWKKWPGKGIKADTSLAAGRMETKGMKNEGSRTKKWHHRANDDGTLMSKLIQKDFCKWIKEPLGTYIKKYQAMFTFELCDIFHLIIEISLQSTILFKNHRYQ